jgi:hypothetical protein
MGATSAALTERRLYMVHKIGSLQIGTDRAQAHDLTKIEANIGVQYQSMAQMAADEPPRPRGMLTFTTERKDRCARLWFSPEGIEELLDTFIGGLPMGFTVRSKRLKQLCAMILSGNQGRYWIVQQSFSDTPEVWTDVQQPNHDGRYDDSQDAFTAAVRLTRETHPDLRVRYRVCERYDHPSDPV